MARPTPISRRRKPNALRWLLHRLRVVAFTTSGGDRLTQERLDALQERYRRVYGALTHIDLSAPRPDGDSD